MAVAIAALGAGAGAPAHAQASTVRALAEWQAGRWAVAEPGGRRTLPRCLSSPLPMLIGGDPPAACDVRVIEESADSAVLLWRCRDGRSGRTALRRDTQSLYVVHVQGLDEGRPFAQRSEWRREGDC